LTKLAKFLKPFLAWILLTLALLFGQAMCDLNLPNLMSEIVNVGIQQSGIPHAAPDAISQNGMKLMRTFMTDEGRRLVEESYKLADTADSAGGTGYAKLYPAAGTQLYVKLRVDEAVSLELDAVFETAAWTMAHVLQEMEQQPGQSLNIGGSMDIGAAGLEWLYDLLPVFVALPPSCIDAAWEDAVQVDGTVLQQSGIAMAKAFYRELGVDIGARQSGYIVRTGAWMLAVALLGGIATVLVCLLSSRIAAGVARNLRREVFKKIESFSLAELDRFSAASLITRCTNDITQIQQVLMFGVRMVCYAPIMAAGGIVMAVRKSPSMSWIIALSCLALIGLICVVLSVAVPKFKVMQKLVDRLNLVSREALSGMMVIRAFGTQEHEKTRFQSANTDFTKTSLFITRVMSLMMPAMTLIMNGVTVLVVWVGARQIASSAMQVGDMMAFMQYAMQIITSFLMISMMFLFIPRAAVAGARVAEVLETENSIVDPKEPGGFDEGKRGVVEFRNVCFRYPGAERDTLKDITFTARPGQTTAIIGPTGSGKSTIANLVLRFFDASEGQVLVGGADVREVEQKALRGRIGYAPQKGMLLSGTIASNLRYGGNGASDEDIAEAAAIAQAMEFIRTKPEGFDSEVAQGGANLSGGQKQRLSIARALAKNPEILVLDDTFSALDFKTDAALRRALRDRAKNCTILLVAQRVSTIMNAEQIIVLDEGRIVGIGTHRQLLAECPQYFEIASSQLSQEELA